MASNSSRKTRGPEWKAETRKSATQAQKSAAQAQKSATEARKSATQARKSTAQARKSATELPNRAKQVALFGSPRKQKLHEQRTRLIELRQELLKLSQQEKVINCLYLFFFLFYKQCSK